MRYGSACCPWVHAGWVPGVGIRVGIPGEYPASSKPTDARGAVLNQRSGPRKSQHGAGVGGFRAAGVTVSGHGQDHPSGPVGPLQGPPCPSLSECPPRAKGARFHLISYKVSQNAEVSPKYVKKASHSPYSQKRVQKSPLQFLRFPFSVAFSHKE